MAISSVAIKPPVIPAVPFTVSAAGEADPFTPITLEEGAVQAYDGPGWTWAPGFLNIIWVPMDFVMTLLAWCHAKASGDEEGEFDAGLRLAGMPISLMEAFCSALTTLFQCAYVVSQTAYETLQPIAAILSVPTLVFGLGFCLIQAIYESLSIGRAIALINHTEIAALNELNELLQIRDLPQLQQRLGEWLAENPEISLPEEARVLHRQLTASLQNPQLVDEKLWALKDQFVLRSFAHLKAEYLDISEAEKTRMATLIQRNFPRLSRGEQQQEYLLMSRELLLSKRSNLERRVRPWCAQEIARKLPDLMAKLNNPDLSAEERRDARVEAEALMNKLDTQSRKKLAIHIVGLIALAISAAGFLCTLVACPALIPFFLLIGGGLVSTLSYIYGKAALDQEGWGMSPRLAFEATMPPVAWLYYKMQDCCSAEPAQPA